MTDPIPPSATSSAASPAIPPAASSAQRPITPESRPASWRGYLMIGAATLLIYVAALVPNMGHPLGDKTEHFAAFAFLGFLSRRSGTKLSSFVVGLPVLLILGLGIEIFQYDFSPSRAASLSDALASGMGAAAGMVAGTAQGKWIGLAVLALALAAIATNWALNGGPFSLR